MSTPRCVACLDTKRCGICRGVGEHLQRDGTTIPCADCGGTGRCRRC